MASFPRSDVAFSLVREDPRIEAEVVGNVASHLGRPARVLLIASGGCTALSLCTSVHVGSLTAFDTNEAQLHLLEIKRACLHMRDPSEARAFLQGKAEHWSRTYEEVRRRLPWASRVFWDQRPTELELGVLRTGRFEVIFSELRSALKDAGIDVRDRSPGSHRNWNRTFEHVFRRERLIEAFGPSAVARSTQRSFGLHFAAVFADALRRFSLLDNHFLSSVLLEDPLSHSVPDCFRDADWEITSRCCDRIELSGASVDDALASSNEMYDVIHLSNVSDWMPHADIEKLVRNVRDRLSIGGAAIFRRLNGDQPLGEIVARHLRIDERWNEALRAADRSFFYREVVVGERER